MVKREKAVYLIQSVSHAIEVLEQLSNSNSEVGVTELSKKLNLHKNNVFRLLATLEICGVVQQNPKTENYRLGAKALKLSQAFELQNPISALISQFLSNIAEKTQETVNFWIAQEGKMYCHSSIESKKMLRAVSSYGASESMWESTPGRLLMAFLKPAELSKYQSFAGFKSLTKEEEQTFSLGKAASATSELKRYCCVIKSAATIVGVVEIVAVATRADDKAINEALIDNCQALSEGFGGSLSLNVQVEKTAADYYIIQERI